ncbi:MAG: DEAD/DEAH box helicase family protein, partial [Chloroflexi bacterium]|nr:DEAD/DEAH box helicase family protein [Chloroflexota bacterium]
MTTAVAAPGRFELVSDFRPTGDQPQAIARLADGVSLGFKSQTLLGVTGSGKTFTMANIIQSVQRPTLVLAPNRTLAAQLFTEFKEFFPHNAVEYFVSYYDYYQPEAYIPQRDIYIEKDASINDRLDRLRLSATSSVMSRPDVVVVASVSCLYGLGSPEDYRGLVIHLQRGQTLDRDALVSLLIQTQYRRNDFAFERGQFRVRGDVLELRPAYGENALRLEFFGDELEGLAEVDPVSGEVLARFERFALYPAKHFVSREGVLERALTTIATELEQRLNELRRAGKELEAQRLESRTRYDLEMLEEVG